MLCTRCKGTGYLPDTIGSLIRTTREDLGLSQAQVAERAGISRNGYALIEHGGNAQIETLYAIASALGFTLSITLDAAGDAYD